MNYNEYIQNIINVRGRFGVPDGEYKERHHILPKCMGGNNSEENLIDLYAREHFQAHRLLALENPHNNKIVSAWWLMCSCKRKCQDRYDVTAEECAKKYRVTGDRLRHLLIMDFNEMPEKWKAKGLRYRDFLKEGGFNGKGINK